jgi:hypothetical protein
MTAKTAKASPKKTKISKSRTKPAAKASPAVKAEVVEKVQAASKRPDSKRSLRMWNIRLGVVLILLAVVVVVIGNSSTVPLTTQYLSKDALATEAAGGKEVLAPAIRHVADVRVSWLVAKFLIIAGVVYLLAATLLRKHYEAWLDRGVNKLRWAGFGLAGGVAVAAISMLGGVSDLAALLLIFGSVVLAAVFAVVLELLGGGRRLRRLLATGAVVGLVLPWLGFVINIAGVLKYNGSLPLYLYFLYGSITLWFIVIGLATHLRIKQSGRWADTIYTEKAFMFLGFVVAVVLAAQIFVGVLQ